MTVCQYQGCTNDAAVALQFACRHEHICEPVPHCERHRSLLHESARSGRLQCQRCTDSGHLGGGQSSIREVELAGQSASRTRPVPR